MKIHKGLDHLPEFKNAVVTSGTFDGVHLGHGKLLEKIRFLSEENAGETVLMTFWPHPRIVLDKNKENLRLLTSMDEKIELLSLAGIDHLIVVPFTKEFSETSSQEFIEDILVKKLNTKVLVIGYNHRFGHNRAGSFEELKKNSGQLGFKVHEISKEEVDSIAVSSTKIRNFLAGKNIREANALLGRPYFFSGHVVRGRAIGKGMGFPTANIENNEPHKLMPGEGVYAVRLRHDGSDYGGMMNIGHRPTFEDSGLKIEVHVFDFSKEIYGEKVEVSVLDFIREEQKFKNAEELKQQLEKDKKQAINVLNSSL